MNPGDSRSGRFPTTQWNLVLMARAEFSQESQAALAALCRTYWYPLYAFIRREGYSPEQAQDLTQSFFARFLEKQYVQSYERERGRFRSFLLASLKHFLSNERDWERAKKRGGGVYPVPLDAVVETAEHRYTLEPKTNLTPETIFERQWARTLLDQVLARLESESKHFDRLKGFLIGDAERVPYRELAADLATTEGALKVSVHRLRRRFREILREEISHTVSDPAEVQDEIRYLMAIL